ncbi:unnamed protein product [Arabidopsis thaliana]|uniref:Uncharacterized protein n=1 Tax=Arabidopsis thaliana TaxID=3702 RepID=A0A654GG79_ARATH|nr:unnamed protein product [Arabidopsis thaliana]
MKKRASPRKCPLIKQVGEQNRSSDSSRFSEGDHESINAISIEKLLVMYLTIKSIMLLRKYLLVTESQVSKCGFHIVKKKGDVLYPKRTKYSKYRKGRCSRGCKPDGTKLGFGRYGTKSCLAVVDLPADTEGNEIALNPSVSSLYNEIESSDSLRARNRLLSESWERVEGTERALQNEGDPGRRRELTARLDQEIRTLQRQIHLGRRADSIRDRQIAEWRGRFNTELAGIEEESARRAFLNWCLRVLIHAHEDQPPQN